MITLVAIGLAQAALPDALTPMTDPARWVTTDDYPAEALKAKAQGGVRVRLAINAAGRVSDCTVVESSGHASLDEGTCATMSKRAAFNPGAPNRFAHRTIVWSLPDQGASGEYYTPTEPIEVTETIFSDSILETEIVLDEQGRVETCRVIETKPPSPFDACADVPAGMSMGPGHLRDGKPIKAHIRKRMTISTTFPE
ncbi:energy transducer TonB [Sphingomonas gilva]|uniref:Energy transducer TonB n=1 Tax=Sphingomonas gilva TaxID=2305907 RepID=A0A396RNE2_9SPHN|nr:energy transducer TonB [Sphingomonas gilva]RHW17266.1 energy transducer TonB [Sphingomonas gilva]